MALLSAGGVCHSHEFDIPAERIFQQMQAYKCELCKSPTSNSLIIQSQMNSITYIDFDAGNGMLRYN